MELQLSMENRIRGLLKKAVVRAELLAIGSWVVVNTITQAHVPFKAVLISFIAMLMVFCIQTFTRSDKVWRLSGLVFILTFAGSFKFLFMQLDALYQAFSLPFAVITVLGASLLVRNATDYIVTAVISWLMVWPYIDVDLPEAARYILVFGFFSVALGWVNNHTYMASLRGLLVLESQYRVMAETDFLTGIFNRRALMQRFEQVAAGGKRGFFLMIDVDNFKSVNDRWGHEVGDQVLCALARCMASVDHRYCHGRLGGEEFGVLLETPSETQALEYAQQLMHAVRTMDSLPCRFTVSAGLVAFMPGCDISQVLREADRQLYAAKKSGKDNVKYDPFVKGSLLSSV